MIIFHCPKCRKEYQSKDEYAGKTFSCSDCGLDILIPALANLPRHSVKEASDSIMTAKPASTAPPKQRISFNCPNCNSAIKVSWEAAGKKGQCRTCGETIQIPPFDAPDKQEEDLPTLEVDDRNEPKPRPRRLPTLVADDDREPKRARRRDSEELVLHGRQGKTVIVAGAVVRIVKKAWVLAAQRERSIQIRAISSVEVKKPGIVTEGFIQFSIAGGHARDSSFTWTGGAFDAAADENSIVFADQDAYEIALQIKEYVENFQEKSSSPSSPASAADEIFKLKELMDQGIITRQEFAKRKRRIMES